MSNDGRVSAEEAVAVAKEVVAACPELEDAPFDLAALISAVIRGSNDNLDALEKEAQARGLTGEVAAGLMAVGAMYEVGQDLVGPRRGLVEAGRAVGRLMRRRMAAKISETLEQRKGRAS